MRTSIARELLVNIVIFVTVIGLGIAYLLVAVYHVSPGKKYTSVSMQLDNTYLIVDGTGVFVSGVKVGSVTSVTPNRDGAEVKMKFASSQRIPQSSRVEIGQQSAIGEPYVDFEPAAGGGPYLTGGMRIDARQVSQPESISNIFGLIQQLSTTFDADPMAGLANTVWQALDGAEDAMPALSNGARLLSGVLVSRQAKMRAMFANTQIYTSDLDWIVRDLGAAGEGAARMLTSLRQTLSGAERLVKPGQLHKNLAEVIDPFLAKLNGKLSSVWPNLMDAFGPLVPIATAINQTLPQIDVSALLSSALGIFGSDGAARLQITVPPKVFPPNTTTTTRPPAR